MLARLAESLASFLGRGRHLGLLEGQSIMVVSARTDRLVHV